MVRSLRFDVPNVFGAVLLGYFLLCIIFCLQLIEPLQEVLELRRILVGVDDESRRDGLEYMVILLIIGILMAIVMLKRANQARFGANEVVILEMVQHHIPIFVVSQQFFKTVVKVAGVIEGFP